MTTEDPSLVDRLRRLNSTVVADVLDECGYPDQALASAIRPLAPDMLLAGRAVCFAGETIVGSGAGTPALSNYEIDSRLAPGTVAVIATGGHDVSAVVGGLMCLGFARRGCAGVLCDGGVRDAAEIVALKLPTFSRFVTPLRSNGRWQLTRADAPVECPGQTAAHVRIAPGDYVIGDADGVMVVPQAIAHDVVAWAEELARIESAIVRGLGAGEAREAVFAANPRFRHIRRLR